MSTPVLVTGATGRQGGATARALLAAGVPVRALVRDRARAQAVAALGAELVVGDLDDRESLDQATAGVRAVFSIQMPRFTGDDFDYDGEVRQAINLMESARVAGVRHFVYSSATGTGQHLEHSGWVSGRWPLVERSLTSKTAIQDRLRTAGFPVWTLLKPGFFMDNFLPSMQFMFPRGLEGGLVSVIRPETKLSLVATPDVGAAAAAAILDPERFNAVELELASDHRSMTEIAAVLSAAWGVPLRAPAMTLDEAVAAGMPLMGSGHDFFNVVHQPGRPEYARELGIPLTSFEAWAGSTAAPRQ